MKQNNPKLKTITYIWILMTVLVAFPIVWSFAARNASVYAVDMQVVEGALAVNPAHPLAPNRLERFGTDALGRSVATLIAHGMPQALGIGAIAAAIRASAGLLLRRKKIRINPGILIAIELIFFRFLLQLPYFTGDSSPNTLILAVLFGSFVLPAIAAGEAIANREPNPVKGESPRIFFLLWVNQFARVLLILFALGLAGTAIGADPYAKIPIEGAAPYTDPFVMNQVAQIWRTKTVAPWVWAIPTGFLLWAAGVLYALYRPMKARFTRRGTLLPENGVAFFEFLNPIRALRELKEFRNYTFATLTRLVFLGILGVLVILGKPEPSDKPKNPPVPSYSEIAASTDAVQSAEDKIRFAEKRFSEWKLNVVHENFLDEITTPEGTRPIAAASLIGRSRAQPLLLLFDTNSDPETFALQMALIEGIVHTGKEAGFAQSYLFAFTENVPGTDYLGFFNSYVLRTPERAVFVSIPQIGEGSVSIDETLLVPNSAWGGRIANELRDALEDKGVRYAIDYFEPPDGVAADLARSGMMGIQARTTLGDETPDKQKLLEGLLEGALRFGYTER